jgi:hypothetical protein
MEYYQNWQYTKPIKSNLILNFEDICKLVGVSRKTKE